MKKYLIAFSVIALTSTAITSCSEDFIDTQFFQSKPQEDIKTIEELQSFVFGAYGTMRGASYYGCDFVTIPEVRSDEMYSNNRSGYYSTVSNYTMLSNDSYASGPYTAMYTTIAKANIILGTSNNLTWGETVDPTKIALKIKQLKGQAYAVRAQALFDALRLFGQQYSGGTTGVVVPLQYNPSANMARSSVQQTQAQIEADFNNALTNLTGNSNQVYEDKTVLNEFSVKALMSRYYLYKGDYAKVRSLVKDVVASGKYSVIPRDSYLTSWTLNNAASNSVFELAVGPIAALGSTSINSKISPDNGYQNVPVKPIVLNYMAEEDIRKSIFAGSGNTSGIFIAAKYPNKNGEDNIRVSRYEEVILNGIEAELKGGDPAKAQGYWELLLKNRLKDIVDAQGNVIKSIAKQIEDLGPIDFDKLKEERRKELIGEGFRMWDLLRWGGPIPKNATNGNATANIPVGDNRLAFPIPLAETNVAGTLVKSNPGYDN
ncbi:RagB/SusD family nutrient uptake outer membrane protein [Chryseobacterium cucumeris]|uniref:RagB/SusD family nutrient uptake outer membrane protein n=1 Tax=Chryseobacterium cucumeris TaxID=1813611 RepID=A0ABX9X6R7_9FLAO|nr:RagB/SusD family nutrient uptake outer membrane protein [Chryseobacterium cucumeris]MDH5035088.1 RagB/SusD family nutrient uptake outer membrane protein [Chryseobacterium cucumeris]ROH92403.1 RagB/SusD family nutrient uptake outer membrane protein [Chryseobacterium cucumeris]